MLRNSARLFTLTLLGGSLIACSGGGGDRGGSVTRDSAGVQIVVSATTGTWSDADRPTFTEALQIGGSPTDSNYMFGAVGAVDIASDGTIYVLDPQAQVVRSYDSTGKFLRNIGRRGAGPGEMMMATALFATTADTLLVMDMGGQSLVVFGADGSSRGEISMPMTEGIPVKWVEREDGSVVSQIRVLDLVGLAEGLTGRSTGARAGSAGRSGSRAGSVDAEVVAGTPPPQVDRLIVRSASGKVADTLLTLPSGETMQVGGSNGMTMRLFAPEPMWTLSEDGGVYYGVNDEYSINVYDKDGTLKRIVRRDVERKPVTEEAKTAIKSAMVKAMQEAVTSRGGSANSEMMDRMTSMIGFADYFPALGNLMGGPGNTLWVQQPRSAAELTEMASTLETQDLGSPKWDVYDKDGKLLGDVTMPDNFVAMRWIGDRLAGVYTDANGVPSLKILRVSGL